MTMNDHDLLLSLGGPAKVAKICNISPQAVSQWKKNGIPRSVKNLLVFYAANRGKDATRAPGAAELAPAHEAEAPT